MSTFTVPTIFSAVDKMTAPLKRMQGSMSSFANKSAAGIGKLDRRLRKLTPSLGSMGKQMLAFASTGALIAGIGGAINIVKDYEQANADLSAVMNTTVSNQNLLSKDAERLGSITAKSATEVVGLQEAYARLGFTTPQVLNMTEATINGSIAMNSELAATAELTGAVVNSFDAFSSIDSTDILDKMTLATQKSALNFEKLNSALPNVAGAANAAGVDFDQLLGLLGKLSDAGIDASASGTALKNIFIKAAAKGSSYGEILETISNSSDKLTASVDATGKIAAVSANILAANLTETAELTDKLTNGFKGSAKAAADKRLQTFGGSLTLLSSAYEGLNISNSTGALGGMSSIVRFVTDNITTLAVIIGVVVGAFVALKLAVLAGQVAMFAYNVVIGVSAAMSATQATSIGASNVAMRAQQIATYAVIAAQWVQNSTLGAYIATQWAANAALAAFPLTWVIIGILALIAAVVAIIVYWDDWGASIAAIGTIVVAFFSTMFFWVGIIISAVQSFRRNWDNIVDAFTNGGIIDGLLMIGATILDVLLYPLQQILEIAESFTGMDLGSAGLKDFRASMGLNVESGEETETLNPEQAKQESLTKSISESVTKDTKDINLTVNGTEVDTSGGGSANSVIPSGSTMTGGQ